MKNLMDIKYDWLTSNFYKKREMNKWTKEYIKNNDIDFKILKNQLEELIIKYNLICLLFYRKTL